MEKDFSKYSNWYNLGLNDIYSKLSSSKDGITEDDAKKRLDKCGKNSIASHKKIGPLKILLNQFKDFFVLILFFAFLISFSLGEYVDGFLILFVIVFDALLGFIQDFKAEKSIEALNSLMSLKSVVLRNKKRTEIDSEDLVSGDVVFLDTGAKVPADLRIIEGSNIEADESILTGESVSVEKIVEVLIGKKQVADQHNMLFSGTVITKGTCTGIVVETGFKTEIGKISKKLSDIKEEETPLQKGLSSFAKKIGIVVVLICMCVFILNALRGVDIIDSLFVSLSLAVAAVPQSLPAVVTISLAIGVKWMSKNNALVRKLSSVETLGCTTVICTDKTGTLTKNEMTVTKVYMSGKNIDVFGTGYDINGNFTLKGKKYSSTDLKKLLEISCLCNNSSIDFKNQKLIGDPTEVSLLVSSKKYGIDFNELQKYNKRIDEVPFDSDRKMMSTVHKKGKKTFVCTKGSIQSVLLVCNKVLYNGKVVSFTQKLKNDFLKKNDFYADNALRVLSFAYKDITSKTKKKDYEKDLIFVGIVAMIDPPRVEVKDMIKEANKAGIKVVMITGDNVNTAKAIGREVGILGDAVSGDDISKLSDDELLRRIEDITIYARVSPSDKLRIVTLLQSKGHVVSMTGDGVNDALALKKSDIGVAMGLRGCDVAKESASMILTDDSFKSIVLAVKEGRRIFDNIRKFIGYMISSNMMEILVVLSCAIIGLPLPLTAVQLLFINIFTDGAPAIAMGFDPSSKNVMERKPRKKSEGVIDERMKISIFFISILSSVLILTLYWILDPFENYRVAQTSVFATIVVFEMVKLFIIRKIYDHSLFDNKYLFPSMLISIIGLLVLLYVPLVSSWFKLVPLFIEIPIILFFLCIFLAINVIFLHILKKHFKENNFNLQSDVITN
jgi:P-type Ca2+ transporter type 2C